MRNEDEEAIWPNTVSGLGQQRTALFVSVVIVACAGQPNNWFVSMTVIMHSSWVAGRYTRLKQTEKESRTSGKSFIKKQASQ